MLLRKGVSKTPLPAVVWLTTESPALGLWPLMKRSVLVADPRSMTPWVSVMMPLGRSISIGFVLFDVIALAALTASRSLAHDVPEQATGGESSPVPVTVRTVTEACAGARSSARPRPRNRTVQPASAHS